MTNTERAIHTAELALNYLYVLGHEKEELYKHINNELLTVKAVHQSAVRLLMQSQELDIKCFR